jgi:cobalt/nickel transport system permease protein
MVMLIATTKFLDLIYVLKRLRLPGILITNISLMYRYLFLLLFEAERMSRARACREFRPAKLRIWHSNRNYLAMCARGWKV